jgi:predicted phage replisome organizer
MANNKYRKDHFILKENFFDNRKISALELMKDGAIYINILLQMYAMGVKNNGCLMLKNKIPYTATTLAQILGYKASDVERALKVFEKLELIRIADNGAISMLDYE